MPRVGDAGATYLGVDPGASGGIVSIRGNLVAATKMPETEQDVWTLVSSHSHLFGESTFAALEKVGGYVGDGGNPGSAMFKFGASYGGLRMALTAARIPFEEVTPQSWQKGLAIPKREKGESKTDWKNRLKRKAQQLFPSVEVTLATADALLIAEYCRRVRQGKL